MGRGHERNDMLQRVIDKIAESPVGTVFQRYADARGRIATVDLPDCGLVGCGCGCEVVVDEYHEDYGEVSVSCNQCGQTETVSTDELRRRL